MTHRASVFVAAMVAALVAALAAPSAFASAEPGGAAATGQAVVVGEAAAGTLVRVPRGRTLLVELKGVPTAGYVWRLRAPPPGVRLVSTESRPVDPVGRAQGMVGGSDWTLFRLAVDTRRPAVIHFDYGRPWEIEAGAAPTQTVSYRVVRAGR